MITVRDALRRLDGAVASGQLATLCRDLGVEIVTLFGSAVDASGAGLEPGDIDLAVGFAPAGSRDYLAVVNALGELIPGDHLDLMDLDRAGPVAQKAAMFGSRVLYEAHPSVTTERELRAYMAYEDTRRLRDLQTRLLRA